MSVRFVTNYLLQWFSPCMIVECVEKKLESRKIYFLIGFLRTDTNLKCIVYVSNIWHISAIEFCAGNIWHWCHILPARRKEYTRRQQNGFKNARHAANSCSRTRALYGWIFPFKAIINTFKCPVLPHSAKNTACSRGKPKGPAAEKQKSTCSGLPWFNGHIT